MPLKNLNSIHLRFWFNSDTKNLLYVCHMNVASLVTLQFNYLEKNIELLDSKTSLYYTAVWLS